MSSFLDTLAGQTENNTNVMKKFILKLYLLNDITYLHREQNMYKVKDPETAARIIDSMRPSLIFVTVPFAVDISDWLNKIKKMGYSVIPVQIYSTVQSDSSETKKTLSDLNNLIKIRRERGNVLVYGFMSVDELDAIMPEEYAHIWWYPNKQTEYHKLVLQRVQDKNKIGLPVLYGELWDKSISVGTKPNMVIALTKKCHELQKNMYEQHLSSNNRIMIVLI